jgi:hypothetical protein
MAQTELVDAYSRDNNWCYFGGGQYVTEYQKNKKAHHYNYFMKAWPDHFKHQPYIGHEERCVCNTPIKQQCYIINRDTKEVVVLGNCCIEKLRLSGRTCSRCHAKHRNRKDNLCNDCRVIVKKQEELIEYNATRCIEQGCDNKKNTWRGKSMPRCYTCYKKKQNSF